MVLVPEKEISTQDFAKNGPGSPKNSSLALEVRQLPFLIILVRLPLPYLLWKTVDSSALSPKLLILLVLVY